MFCFINKASFLKKYIFNYNNDFVDLPLRSPYQKTLILNNCTIFSLYGCPKFTARCQPAQPKKTTQPNRKSSRTNTRLRRAGQNMGINDKYQNWWLPGGGRGRVPGVPRLPHWSGPPNRGEINEIVGTHVQHFQATLQ